MGKIKMERILQVLIGICLIVLVYTVVDSLHERVVVTGDTAPNFHITTDDGRTVTRSDFGGKVLVLNFWATWCPPCVEEMPSLDQFQKTFADSGVVVLGVSVDKNEQLYRNLLSKVKVSFQTARDPEAKISANYGTFKFPETYVIDSDGKVVMKLIGPENWTDQRMISQIKALL